MHTFFKVFFACLLAILVAGLAGVFLLIVLGSGIGSAFTSGEKPQVKPGTVLLIDLAEGVQEQGREENFDMNTFTLSSVTGLHEMIAAVYHAIGDTSVKALYLQSRGNALGYAATEEFGAAIDSFRASGKPVVAYADVMPQRAYEIAHRASHLYAQPHGVVEWVGYHVDILFFKNLLDKLEITPEIFYAGQFKSATEPYRLTQMSEANRVQYRAFLQSIYANRLLSVQHHRGIDTALLTAWANNLEIRTSEQALAHGLVDGLLYEDQVRDTLRRLAGIAAKEAIPFMKLRDYVKATRTVGSGNRIAVVYAEGTIVGGKSDEVEVASDNYRAILGKLRNDDKVKAVVLRINSPGGSAIASEIIWRELELLKKEKPLVVSMGDYAASGGYYIACNADSIFAQPNTLTGSIGVFTIMVDANKMLKNKLGITFDGVSTNTYADFGSVTRPMRPYERIIAQRDVDSTYLTFKQRVMQGRNLRGTLVDSIAQGRVWTGQDALNIGLVDKIGGLRDAVACAARLAKLDTYTLRTYPQYPSVFEQLMGQKEDPWMQETKIVEKHLGPEAAALMKHYKALSQMTNTPQARLPFLLQLP